MQPLLMLQKRTRLAIPGGSLKKPEPSKNTQKQVKSSSRSWRAKFFSETKKVKQLHSEIPKLKT